MTVEAYLRPTDLGDALAALDEGPWSIIAGGTDFYPARLGKPLRERVLDITAIHDLRAIRRIDDRWHIGALTTWTDLASATQLPSRFDGLKQAAREVGGVQIQNAATICGNLCNASPAADGIPNLLALDAEVELSSNGGKRVVSVAEFVTDNRQTRRLPHEMVTRVIVPENDRPTTAIFSKLGARRYLVISIAMIGAVFEWTPDSKIAAARIAVGACGPVAKRLPQLEKALIGRARHDDLAAIVTPAHIDVLSPIDDVRGTAAYRRDATVTLLRRLLREIRS